MAKFPVDVPIEKVKKVFEKLGFRLVREGNHIAMVRENLDGTRTPLTILRIILTQSGISRDESLDTYEKL